MASWKEKEFLQQNFCQERERETNLSQKSFGWISVSDKGELEHLLDKLAQTQETKF